MNGHCDIQFHHRSSVRPVGWRIVGVGVPLRHVRVNLADYIGGALPFGLSVGHGHGKGLKGQGAWEACQHALGLIGGPLYPSVQGTLICVTGFLLYDAQIHFCESCRSNACYSSGEPFNARA